MTLTRYCKPIADLPVKLVDTDAVLRVLTPLWTTRNETATRLRERIESVLSWAKGRGLWDGENPARWAGHLDEMLAKPAKVQKVKHHAALPYQSVPAFMLELRNVDTPAAKALEFTLLTAARTGETLGATWDEVDLGEKLWTIPAERMKAAKPHRVPLPNRAVEILADMPRHGRVVFNIGSSSMLKVLRRLRPGFVPHGLRSTFRDWAAEATNFPREVCEQALGHAVGNAVERAYRRGDLFEKRRKLMEAWGAYCTRPPSVAERGIVVSLRAT
jgi:integrase